jgi:hypothetical protein
LGIKRETGSINNCPFPPDLGVVIVAGDVSLPAGRGREGERERVRSVRAK